ncbi:MAG: hypothetical protein WCH34_18265 [Bacteroidota bacterium]
MRTTEQIKEKLTKVEKEIKRISDISVDASLSEPYVSKGGNQHPEWSYDDAMTSFVAQRLILEWVLSMK